MGICRDEIGTSSGRVVASKKRKLLAVYLDFLIFGIPWTLFLWLVSRNIPGWGDQPFLYKFLVFSILESVFVYFVHWTPGYTVLGIQKEERLLQPGGDVEVVHTVDRWLKIHERWWTILFGVFMIGSGAKTALRWTEWGPPIPFMGVQLDEPTSAIVSVITGIVEVGVGVAALQLKPVVMILGMVSVIVQSISAWLSWDLIPDWIEAQQVARRAYQGLPVREGEIEFLQKVTPPATVALGLVMLILLVLVFTRSQRACESGGSDPGPGQTGTGFR